MSRIVNTKKNIVFSYLDTVVTLLFTFISRSIIISVLGKQYLGLSSLFASILQVLNMADLGFSGAIIFNMYKPIAENDTIAICALLNFYKSVYKKVALIISIIGTIIIPFLPNFIYGGYPSDINIYLVYAFFLVNTVCSYVFNAYYSALLQALQRLDLTKIGYSLVNILQNLMQLIVLLLFKNYYLFLLLMVVGTISKNVLVKFIANKNFPQYICSGRISKETRLDIISRVKGILICNVSAVTYTTFDNIILSTYIGLDTVTLYNNYIAVYTAIMQFVLMIRTSMQSSVGDSVAAETLEKNYQDVFLWQFLFSAIGTWGAVCMLNLYQPFMELWMGNELMLPYVDVILIALLFFATTSQHAHFLFLGGNGFWWEMRLPYIFSTITNIILNIVLGKTIGISGIIFATLFSTVVFGNIWQCNIIFEKYFKRSVKNYQVRLVCYFFTSVLSGVISIIICRFIKESGVQYLLLRLIISTIVAVIVYIIAYHNTPEYKSALILIRKILKKDGN